TPPGRRGRVSFVFNPRRDGGSTLDDFQLDSGGVLAKGTIELAANGSLETAKLSPIKLSPGDDMRLDLDRAGGVYRVTVKGAVIDARPFLKALSSGADTKAAKDSDSKDFDLDLTANILAGYNDEAM